MADSGRSLSGLTRRTLVFGGAGLAGIAALGARAEQVRITVGALPASTSAYLQLVQHMQLVSKETGIDITVRESAGTEENMILLQRAAIDLGATESGMIKEKLGDAANMRMFAVFSPLVWQIVVARDANVKSLRDLEGKKFNPGPTGGGSTRITMGFLEALGIKPDYFEGTLDDALDAFADRRIVGLSYRAPGASPIGGVVEAGASRPVTFVALSDDEIAVATEKFPGLSKGYIEAGVYSDQPEAIPTLGSWQAGVLSVRKDLSTDVVYALIKAYFDTLPEVAQTYRSLARVTKEVTLEEAALPLHLGVIKYFREQGFTVPDNLIPAEAK